MPNRVPRAALSAPRLGPGPPLLLHRAQSGLSPCSMSTIPSPSSFSCTQSLARHPQSAGSPRAAPGSDRSGCQPAAPPSLGFPSPAAHRAGPGGGFVSSSPARQVCSAVPHRSRCPEPPRAHRGTAGSDRDRLQKRRSSRRARPGQPNTPRPGFVSGESLGLPVKVRINHLGRSPPGTSSRSSLTETSTPIPELFSFPARGGGISKERARIMSGIPQV